MDNQTGAVTQLASAGNPQRARTSFFAELPRAFAYPFRGAEKYLLLGGTLGFTVGFYLAIIIPWAGVILSVLLAGYLAADMLDIIGKSAAGEPEPPDWPDIGNVDDFIEPLVLLLGSILVPLAPALICMFWPKIAMVWAGPLPPADPKTTRLLFCVGLGYVPMAMLAVAMFDSPRAMNPLTVLVAIVKVAPYALVAILVLAADVVVSVVAIDFLDSIPFVGSFLLLYLAMVDMRILGMIYFTQSRRLNWFPDDSAGRPGDSPQEF